jgi:hypothetical protein
MMWKIQLLVLALVSATILRVEAGNDFAIAVGYKTNGKCTLGETRVLAGVAARVVESKGYRQAGNSGKWKINSNNGNGNDNNRDLEALSAEEEAQQEEQARRALVDCSDTSEICFWFRHQYDYCLGYISVCGGRRALRVNTDKSLRELQDSITGQDILNELSELVEPVECLEAPYDAGVHIETW